MNVKDLDFTFSDTIAGYVTSFDWERQIFRLKAGTGSEYEARLTANTSGELVRNLGEAFVDCTGQLQDMVEEGRFLYAFGVFYPEEGELRFEAKHLVFLGRESGEWCFEQQDWWIKQVGRLGDFYLRAQFGDGEIDYSKYRTELTLEGEHAAAVRQETDTISRLVYGFASAYMITGDERYLEAAEKGTAYLRDHMRCVDSSQEIVYWYHAIDLGKGKERKVFASEFGDDYDAIPAYEQIYALAGPTQTYRITGDPAIYRDVEMTCNLFDKYFRDAKRGGYFSHVDPVTLDPRSDTLGRNRARKNWNSVGDHAPAFLINFVLATDEDRYKRMLVSTAETIVDHFPDYERSAFVQEKFHEDWSHDTTWGWQQNRGVVGHNLKIAWNLTRINCLAPSEKYTDFARKIAALMPDHGMDKLRTGWYDVVERTLDQSQRFHRFAWHDRKAWWQQEQGILAYLIMAGTTGNKDYLRLARESSAYYNAWFLDHDSGGVYFNVLAAGLPYLLGTERLKGSHSMSGYHAFELAYLAAVYTNLLITKQHMDFYFKPLPHGFKDNVLRVAPDLLLKGSIRIGQVWIDGKEHTDFDAAELTVKLPASGNRATVKVRIVPIGSAEHFSATIDKKGSTVVVTASGILDHAGLPTFRKALQEVLASSPSRVVVIAKDLETMIPDGARSLLLEKQKLGIDTEFIVASANPAVKETLDRSALTEEITLVDRFTG